jgi:hypothetical protein
MPTIWRLPQVGASKLSQIEITGTHDQFRACGTDPQDGRQRFRCPKDSLPVEGLLRISREKKVPIAFESWCSSRAIRDLAVTGSRSSNDHCGAASPRQNRAIQLFSILRKPHPNET